MIGMQMKRQEMAMLLWHVVLVCLWWCPSMVQAVTLTTRVAAHEKSCFYALAKISGEKLGFYFAVQSGGSFDIDFIVTAPDGKVISEGDKEKSGDFIFTANAIGEYSFCFMNVKSSLTEKVVDFDITVDHELNKSAEGTLVQVAAKNTQGAVKAVVGPSESLLDHMSPALNKVEGYQKYFHTRENRNIDTVKSTRSRITWICGLESVIIVGMAWGQVYLIQNLFSVRGGKKMRV